MIHCNQGDFNTAVSYYLKKAREGEQVTVLFPDGHKMIVGASLTRTLPESEYLPVSSEDECYDEMPDQDLSGWLR